MDAIHSKSVFVYGQVRCALRSGRYAPGQRIDPAGLATEFKTSPTPVRFALYRLVGEGLVSIMPATGCTSRCSPKSPCATSMTGWNACC